MRPRELGDAIAAGRVTLVQFADTPGAAARGALRPVVDAALAEAEKNGTAETLYKKWFMSPIPPKGLNLELPLSDDMKQLFQNPNDKPLQ